MFFSFMQETEFFKIPEDCLSRLIPVHALVFPAVFVNHGVLQQVVTGMDLLQTSLLFGIFTGIIGIA